jgi:hypothetical protein
LSTTVVGATQDQLQTWYPQFSLVVPPRGTAAVRAWVGRLQPFPDGTEFADVMSHLQDDLNVRVEEAGRLVHLGGCSRHHDFFQGFCGIMGMSFEILVLEFEGGRHPRVYGVSPEISRRRFPTHPHLRDDQQVVFNGKPLQALCIYLASDGVLERNDMQLVQVLDYTSMYLAKHLLWTATTRTEEFNISTNEFTYAANRGALPIGEHVAVLDGTHPAFAAYYRTDARLESLEQQIRRWLSAGQWRVDRGLWIGKQAPHFIEELLRDFSDDDECPCGSGNLYGACCRRQHERALGPRRMFR